MQLGAVVVAALMSSQIVEASAVVIQRLSTPPELSSLRAFAFRADRREIVATGLAEDDSCVVALLNESFSLVKLRSIPGALRDSCSLAGLDSSGNIVLTGFTAATDFQFTDDLGPVGASGSQFLLKLSRSSLQTLFSVRVRGPAPYTLAVAPDDTIWLGGFANDGLVTTPDAVQPRYPGVGLPIRDPRDRSGFLSRLSADGRRILYSTYLGALRDGVATISIDGQGSVYAAGSRIWKFSNEGQLIWSTWLRPSAVFGSAIGPHGDLYIAGTTEGLDFYTTPLSFQPAPFDRQNPLFVGSFGGYPNAAFDGFVARFSSQGDLIYSTLLGGIGYDILHQVLVDSDGSAWVRGYSDYLLFPTRGATAMRTDSGSVLAKLAPDGSRVAFSTYLAEISGLLVAHPEGGLWMIASNPAERFGVRRVTELADSLPRIDAVVRAGAPRERLLAGANAVVTGEGFSAVSEVMFSGRTARIVARSADCIEVELPLVAFPQGYGFLDDDLSFRANGDVLRQVRIRVNSPPIPMP